VRPDAISRAARRPGTRVPRDPGSAAEGGRTNEQERLKRENERLLKLLRNEREGIAALIERHEALEKENERLRNENETLEELLADLKDVRF
jgi:predicted RNase H-like nuclease (RuvC/YqgF family)